MNGEVTSDRREIVEDLTLFYKGLLGVDKVDKVLLNKYQFKIKKMQNIVENFFPEIGRKISYNEVYEVITKEFKD